MTTEAVESPAVLDSAWSRWDRELKLAKKERERFEEQGDKIVKRYVDDRNVWNQNAARYNVLWSNVQTLKPALYARTPKPEVRRTFKDKDEVGRVAAISLERALTNACDQYDFDGVMQQSVEDNLLPGLGQLRVHYKPHFRTVTPPRQAISLDLPKPDDYDDETADLQGDDFVGYSYQPASYEEIAHEEVYSSYVYWRDFMWSPARTWEEVRWVAFRSYMRRDQLVERFGDKGKKVTLDYTPSAVKDGDQIKPHSEAFKQAIVWEIWDKDSGQVIWWASGYSQGLLERSRPHLNFEQFFPCPKPLFATLVNGDLMPYGDYLFYQDQAKELDDLTARISALTDALRMNGLYAGQAKNEIQDLLKEENKLIAVEEWDRFIDNGGLKGQIEWMPVAQVAEVLIRLYDARERVKQDMYEITGMSDIIRGASNAAETATAQRIKGNFASLRLQDRQKEVQRFAQDVFALKAEILCEVVSERTFAKMAGVALMDQEEQQAFPMAYRLLKDERIRGFRVEIETDSTIEPDEQAEKQSRIEFIGMATNFLQQAVPAAQQVPEIAPLLGSMLMFGIRGFKAGRQLENEFEDALENLTKARENPRIQQLEAQVKELMDDRQLKIAEMKSKETQTTAKLQSDVERDRMDNENKQIINVRDNVTDLQIATLNQMSRNDGY